MQVEQEVKEIVSRQLGVDVAAVSDKTSFVDDLGADSLSIVELVLAFEEHFKIEIPESETERIVTVGDAISYIQNQRKFS